MLTIPGHKGNANQNHTKIPPQPCQNSTPPTNVGEDMGKKEPSYTAGGNASWYNHFVKQYGSFLKN
jgi:hypothetical protein